MGLTKIRDSNLGNVLRPIRGIFSLLINSSAHKFENRYEKLPIVRIAGDLRIVTIFGLVREWGITIAYRQNIHCRTKVFIHSPKHYDSRSISRRESANDLKFSYKISRTFLYGRNRPKKNLRCNKKIAYFVSVRNKCKMTKVY